MNEDNNNTDTNSFDEKQCNKFLAILHNYLSPGPKKTFMLIDHFPPQWEEQLIQLTSTLWGLSCEHFLLNEVKRINLLYPNFDPSSRTIVILDAADLSDRASIQENLKYFLMIFRNKVALVLGTGELGNITIPNSLGVGVKIRADELMKKHIHSAEDYSMIEMRDDQNLIIHANKVIPYYQLENVKLPPKFRYNLLEIVSYLQTKHRCEYESGFREEQPRGLGITMVFHGKSGTGKTMTAEAIAHELGVPLYVVKLSKVFSKWIGETEKNLKAIFDAAYGVRGVLLFDEGDAIFSKRSEKGGTNERFINMETNFLLQEMEAFDGICIISTNLERTLDNAFWRRFSYIMEFPRPSNPDLVKELWKTSIPKKMKVAPDIDFDILTRFKGLTGGNIKNAVRHARARGYFQDREEVQLIDFIWGIRREFEKIDTPFDAHLLDDHRELMIEVSPDWDDERIRKALLKIDKKKQEKLLAAKEIEKKNQQNGETSSFYVNAK